MSLQSWFEQSTPGPGAPGFRTLAVTRADWRNIARDLAGAGARLLALWAHCDAGPSAMVRAAFIAQPGALQVNLCLSASDGPYPGLEDLFPCASRMQRAVRDLNGICSTDPDRRPWLRHAAWPGRYHPLADPAAPPAESSRDGYDFVCVQGDGVHEIAVGPVHAGTIEPGHFRFSVVGEKVLRLEERLGYAHKGIEQRFTRLPLLEGQRLAARVSGDSAVAFSWAYCQALESLSATHIPDRAVWLRALCLELERIANHLGDLGALGNDAGFAFGLAQFSRLKETLLRATQAALGARYLFDVIVPGGTSADLRPDASDALHDCVGQLAEEAGRLQSIYDEHEGLRDRFNGAGVVTPELAARLGLIGLAGRASGQAFDLRCDLPCAPFDLLAPVKCGRNEGDVAARVAVRFDELMESCRLIALILEAMPRGEHRAVPRIPAAGTFGTGLIEGWRGPVLIGLEAGRDGLIRRCHPHDPSWQNWPVLEHAIIGNIVADFPLINKSFNLSYSGHDL